MFSISRLTDKDDEEDFGYQRILSPARLSNVTKSRSKKLGFRSKELG
jgi:hypothetical protein